MSHDTNTPPIGGADLECLFGFERFTVGNARSACLELATQHGLEPHSDEPFIVADESYEAFMRPPCNSMEDFFRWVKEMKSSYLFIKLVGPLCDQDVAISVSVSLHHKVLTVSTQEDVLWGFTGDVANARIERLLAFFDLCETACSIVLPRNAVIGSEPCHIEEISINDPQSAGRYLFDYHVFFSEAYKKELFGWYQDYGRRWESGRRIV